MFSIQFPAQITRDAQYTWGKVNGLQKALIYTVLSPDPLIHPIATQILGKMNNLLQLTFALKAASYLTGVNIMLLSSVSLSTLFGALIAGIVFGAFMASLVIPKMSKDATDWLNFRIQTNGPLEFRPTTPQQAKYSTQDKLKALTDTLTQYAPHWKALIQNGQADLVANLFTHPQYTATYQYSDEQMTMLGESFKSQYEAFVTATQAACRKGRDLSDAQFQELVLSKVEPLRHEIESQMEFFLFGCDVQRLIDYKAQLLNYLRSQIEDFPAPDECTTTTIRAFTRSFHSDKTKESDTQMQALVQQAAALIKTCKDLKLEEEGSTALKEGLWISNNDYNQLRESREIIEQALIQKGELKERKGMKSPFPLFFTEASQYIATRVAAQANTSA